MKASDLMYLLKNVTNMLRCLTRIKLRPNIINFLIAFTKQSRCSLPLISVSLVFLMNSVSAQSAFNEKSYWYSSATVYATVFVQGGGPDVTLRGLRPIALRGNSEFGPGLAAGFSIGREMVAGLESNIHYRIEGEYWISQVNRSKITVGRITSTASDDILAQAGFLNALVRIGTTERTRWWVGAGIGLAGLSIPAAKVQFNGCNCLGSDRALGLSFRLKAQGEYILTNATSLFAEIGYVYLPSGAVINTTTETRYGNISVPQVGLGMRFKF